MYSYEELDKLTKEKLMRLAGYLKVPGVNMRMLKGEIIEAILEYVKPKEVVEEAMSVRVRRIKESQEI